RAGHLRQVALPGGAAAIREPWRMGANYLREGFGSEAVELPLPFARDTAGRWGPVLEMAAKGVNAPLTSSAGRLFGAAAAVAGLGAVALSGGTFQNLLLLERVMRGLESEGFGVYRHGRVPANDGGISLGQAMVAGAVVRGT